MREYMRHRNCSSPTDLLREAIAARDPWMVELIAGAQAGLLPSTEDWEYAFLEINSSEDEQSWRDMEDHGWSVLALCGGAGGHCSVVMKRRKG